MEIKPKSKPTKSDVQQYSDVASSDDMENDKKNPTPHERADLVVRRLEDFIRKGRTEDGGINFRKWQEMAAVESISATRHAISMSDLALQAQQREQEQLLLQHHQPPSNTYKVPMKEH